MSPDQRLLQLQFDRIAARVAGSPDTDGAQELPERVRGLAERLGLTSFELDVMLLCAGAELDIGVASACAAAQGDPRAVQPTFGLALATLSDPHWSALATSGPLRSWRVLELRRAAGLTTTPLILEERVLEHILGVDSLDVRLEELLVPLDAALEIAAPHQRSAERVASAWRGGGEHPVGVQLTGADVATRRAIVEHACAALGADGYALDAADLPAQPAERDGLVRLWNREALMERRALLVEVDAPADPEARRALSSAVQRLAGRFVIGTDEPLRAPTRPLVEVRVERAQPRESVRLWRGLLPGSRGAAVDEAISQTAAQFQLTPPQLRSIAATLRTSEPEEQDLWGLCRAAARAPMEGLAERIESGVGWADLVLPEQQLAILRELTVHVRQRARVHGDWGFARRSERGLGLGALFAGPSGTGKTLAAEVIANDLKLDLYRIDLSAVVSKYIGETEKNLRRVFDAAEAAGAALLFDEADALFGKRSQVRDSHDRYSNIEVGFLLGRMESHPGLAVLTTNHPEALDDAFTRRLRFTVRFPFPGAEERSAIWRRAFPQETPVEPLELDRLARLNISGGTIRNIALGAAFRAAEEGVPVGMQQVLGAARTEYAKMGRPLPVAELGERA